MVLGDSPDLTSVGGVSGVGIGTTGTTGTTGSAAGQKRAMRIELPGGQA